RLAARRGRTPRDAQPVQAVDGGGSDVFIMHLVAAQPGAGALQAHPRRAGRAFERAAAGHRVAVEVWAVVADEPLCIAAELVRPERMEPPDQRRAIAGGAERVREGGNAGVEDVMVRPAVILVRVPAG